MDRRRDYRVSYMESSISTLEQWIKKLEQNLENLNNRLCIVEDGLVGSCKLDDVDRYRNLVSLMEIEEKLSLQEEEIKFLRKQLSETIKWREENQGKLTMRIGQKKITFEVTGVIGGFLSFLIAGLIAAGGKDIILSPVFLTSIGLVFLFSSIIKSYSNSIKKLIHRRKQLKSPSSNYSN